MFLGRSEPQCDQALKFPPLYLSQLFTLNVFPLQIVTVGTASRCYHQSHQSTPFPGDLLSWGLQLSPMLMASSPPTLGTRACISFGLTYCRQSTAQRNHSRLCSSGNSELPHNHSCLGDTTDFQFLQLSSLLLYLMTLCFHVYI